MLYRAFASPEILLLYSPGALNSIQTELKWILNSTQTSQGFTASAIQAGWTRGLMMASVHGVLMGRILA